MAQINTLTQINIDIPFHTMAVYSKPGAGLVHTQDEAPVGFDWIHPFVADGDEDQPNLLQWAQDRAADHFLLRVTTPLGIFWGVGTGEPQERDLWLVPKHPKIHKTPKILRADTEVEST
jgi:hypothetical protein